MISPLGIIETAKCLCKGNRSKDPSQENLRFAVICAYYAVFHCLCRMCADALTGVNCSKAVTQRGWIEVYRFLGHNNAREACRKIRTRNPTDALQSFADWFVTLQKARESANYPPEGLTTLLEVVRIVESAEHSIGLIDQLSKEERADFAIFLLMTGKGVNDARERWQNRQSNELFVSLNFTDVPFTSIK